MPKFGNGHGNDPNRSNFWKIGKLYYSVDTWDDTEIFLGVKYFFEYLFAIKRKKSSQYLLSKIRKKINGTLDVQAVYDQHRLFPQVIKSSQSHDFDLTFSIFLDFFFVILIQKRAPTAQNYVKSVKYKFNNLMVLKESV